jgi:hypothetical protein
MITMAQQSDRLRRATIRAMLDEADRSTTALKTANSELDRALRRARIRVSNGQPPFGDDLDGIVRQLVAASSSVADVLAEIVSRG